MRTTNINRVYRILEAEAEIAQEKRQKERWKSIELLAQTSCAKCSVDTRKMTNKQIDKWRKHIPDWLIASYDGILHLTYEYHFDNFSTALAFTNAPGALAEREGHHPTLTTAWS